VPLRRHHHPSPHPRLLPLAAALPPPPPEELLPSQATGLVAASQANFMRVIVDAAPPGLDHHRGSDLLCVVRALLKKIRRRVLVGDRVLVGAVDWTDRRGMIEDVLERRSEVADPPVANVDRLVVLFSLDQPRPEPATLTRFLVEAESTGIPFVLVFNKVELVDEQVPF
jgi:ribosome biogenesis GTPase